MIEKAMRYIAELKAPCIREIHGHTYTDKPVTRVKYNPKAKAVRMTTLTSLVDYILLGVDKFKGDMIVHVVSPTEVSFYSALDEDREREELVEVTAQVPVFKFDTFTGHEAFLIGVQSKFADDIAKNKDLVLKFAGTVEDGSVATYGDDGVTQKATVKTGIASKADAVVPSPVALVPYRTFAEVPQVGSDFIFRMKQDKYEGIQCALFEADGGAWKNDAMYNIKAYLQEKLKDVPNVHVIS